MPAPPVVEAAGWRPTVRTWREGMARLTGTPSAGTTAAPVDTRVAIEPRRALAVFLLAPGARQPVLPGHFVETFPGFGLAWASVNGPDNERLMRDCGSANLALGLAAPAIAARPTPATVRGLALAVLVAPVAHFAYHAVHPDLLPALSDRRRRPERRVAARRTAPNRPKC